MPSRPFEIFRLLAAEIDSATASIASTRQISVERAERMRKLTGRRTQSFVELSKHYLPELSHEVLNQAWVEVREKVREFLLQKDDRRRVLQQQVAEVQSRRDELIAQRDEDRKTLDHERLVLSCKTGNFKKDDA